MRHFRLVAFAVLAATVLVASYLTLRSLSLLGSPPLAEVKRVKPGHQEIVLLAPATSSDTWERLVAAVKNLVKEWPNVHGHAPALNASFKRAFLNLTADVPEISLHLEGQEKQKLWIRWYKLASESNSGAWIDKLAQRQPPPLAIIGGDNSDRAYTIARALEACRGGWQGAPPLFLITTATADRFYPGPGSDADPHNSTTWPKVMDIYRGATFRFSFTNTKMAEAVLDFVQDHPDLWTAAPMQRQAAGLAGQSHPLAALGAAAGYHRPTAMALFAWQDDRYSRDLAERFSTVFKERFGPRPEPELSPIHYSVGDFQQPNRWENWAVLNLVRRSEQNQLLVLPTGAQRARRFLRDLCRRAPADLGDLVVLSGDSITFNQVYRDWESAWNFLDMPVPLLFFSHRDPVDTSAGFGQVGPDSSPTTGTQDLLLYRDIVETLVQAAFQEPAGLADARVLPERLRRMHWVAGHVRHPEFRFPPDGDPPAGLPLFDAEGNRQTGTGEHIVWLKPELPKAKATITIWRRDREPDGQTSWRSTVKPLVIPGAPSRAAD